MDARKADTRRKIQLGGLIIKAGIAGEFAAALLSVLLEAGKKLAGPGGNAARERWQAAGAAGLTGRGACANMLTRTGFRWFRLGDCCAAVFRTALS